MIVQSIVLHYQSGNCMPTRSPPHSATSLLLDARPDQLDLRDREFQPGLQHLPSHFPALADWQNFLPTYFKHELILDQGQNGACTGFALAALIQYCRARYEGIYELLSPRMLYHLARFYDEFPGENYQGSSCRGALKAWHRHGVCRRDLWPFQLSQSGKAADYQAPLPGWAEDALQRRLGVYYRVNKNSIADMQAALLQAGVLYVSASIHSGWFLADTRTTHAQLQDWQQLPVIPSSTKPQGGHAFALLGYTPQGFIVQNSWGKSWGWQGLALLPYQDWLAHGHDAWVFSLGPAAPQQACPAVMAFLQQSFSGPSRRLSSKTRSDTSVISEDAAYQFLLLSGRDGQLQQRLVQYRDKLSACQQIVRELPQRWLGSLASAKQDLQLGLLFLDGLADEVQLIAKVQTLAPLFLQAGVYPLFISQTSDLLSQLANQLQSLEPQLHPALDLPHRSAQQIRLLQQTHLPALWLAHQYSASLAALPQAGQTLFELQQNLLQLRQQTGARRLHLHLISEASGVYLMQQAHQILQQQGWQIPSMQILAPLCELNFARNNWPDFFKNNHGRRTNRHYYLLDQLSQKHLHLVDEFQGNAARLFGDGLELAPGKTYLAWYQELLERQASLEQLRKADRTELDLLKKILPRSTRATKSVKQGQQAQSGIHLIRLRQNHILTNLICKSEIHTMLLEQIKSIS